MKTAISFALLSIFSFLSVSCGTIDIPVNTGGGPIPYGQPGFHVGHQGFYGNNGPVQVGDPRQRIYGNGPQSYATFAPQPMIRYNPNR